MDMLTIGAFAKACRLSPKALRLYDELHLLRPARVDPHTGYRYYTAGQLERARLVAWLRRIGMPLALIREVCARQELDPASAAAEVRAYWARVEAETAVRRDLAAFLVGRLSTAREDPVMLELRYAARSDRGLVRPANQDAAHAGRRVLAVADGYGPGGAGASGAAVRALTALDSAEIPVGGVLDLLEDAVREATEAVREAAGPDAHGTDAHGTGGSGTGSAGCDGSGTGSAGCGGSGTTLTAMVWTGSALALAHIGDSRAYVLRDGALFRITHDHTLVQSLLDEGRLTPEEAETHPRRFLLLKSLSAGTGPLPDLRLHEARPGDRYLLCSDGLSAAVPEDAVRRLLTDAATPADAADALTYAANEAGGPDNVSCVIADVLAPAG